MYGGVNSMIIIREILLITLGFCGGTIVEILSRASKK